jgi:hypothetical protein
MRLDSAYATRPPRLEALAQAFSRRDPNRFEKPSGPGGSSHVVSAANHANNEENSKDAVDILVIRVSQTKAESLLTWLYVGGARTREARPGRYN